MHALSSSSAAAVRPGMSSAAASLDWTDRQTRRRAIIDALITSSSSMSYRHNLTQSPRPPPLKTIRINSFMTTSPNKNCNPITLSTLCWLLQLTHFYSMNFELTKFDIIFLYYFWSTVSKTLPDKNTDAKQIAYEPQYFCNVRRKFLSCKILTVWNSLPANRFFITGGF